jgi:MoxR-like ATPase
VLHAIARNGELLEQIGLHGFASIERPILAGLALGDPILLVGPHGTGKTALAQGLARAFGWRFHAYDAAKSLWEDVLGFVDPRRLSEGVVDYVPTKISIWGVEAVLVDELSHANPQLQSKWFELIRARTIMGAPLPDLKQVFAAMNPSSYSGTFPLDEALAGRFVVVARVPEFRDMSRRDRVAVIANDTDDDARACRRRTRAARGSGIRELVLRVRRRYEALDQRTAQALVRYVDACSRVFEAREHPLDGRRTGMLRRLLGSSLCVEAELRGSTISLEAAGPALLEALENGVPFAATGTEVDPCLLRAAHEAGLAAALGRAALGPLRLPADPIQAVFAFMEEQEQAPVEERRAALTRILARANERAGSPERRALAGAAVGLLAKAVCDGNARLGNEDSFRVLDRARALTSGLGRRAEILRGLREASTDDPARPFASARAMAALRLAIDCVDPSSGVRHGVSPAPDPATVARVAAIVERRLAEIGEQK